MGSSVSINQNIERYNKKEEKEEECLHLYLELLHNYNNNNNNNSPSNITNTNTNTNTNPHTNHYYSTNHSNNSSSNLHLDHNNNNNNNNNNLSHNNSSISNNNIFICNSCKYQIINLQRIQNEENWLKIIDNEENNSNLNEEERIELSCYRGITIKWLLEFTKQHNCWYMPTWMVRNKFILPATEQWHCRYVDIPELKNSTIIGKASTYVSHCWNSQWGVMVTAVCSGADPNRRVWLDIFAVRQWPSNYIDVDYRGVIKKCSSFILCCSDFPGLKNLNEDEIHHKNIDVISIETRQTIGLFRMWCLVELHTAILSGLTVIIRGGSFYKSWLTSQYIFHNNSLIFEKLVTLIDLNHSETSLSSDRDRLLRDVEECPGGIEGLNSLVRGIIKGSIICSNYETILNAACGDQLAIDTMMLTRDISLIQASSGGYLNLVKLLIENNNNNNSNSDIKLETKHNGFTALMIASAGGHVETVKYLIDHGASVSAINDLNGNTSLSYAAMNGFHETCKHLLLKGAQVDVVNKLLQTPLCLAAKNGHTATVTFLLSRGAIINHHDINGSTPLYLAVIGGHLSTIRILISKGASKNIKTIEGYTPLSYAEKHQMKECMVILNEQTESKRPR